MKTAQEILEFCEKNTYLMTDCPTVARTLEYLEGSAQAMKAVINFIKSEPEKKPDRIKKCPATGEILPDAEGWIPNTTGEQPVGDDIKVQVLSFDGTIWPINPASYWAWGIDSHPGSITHYRIVKNEAGEEMQKDGSFKHNCQSCKEGKMAWEALKKYAEVHSGDTLGANIIRIEKEFKKE